MLVEMKLDIKEMCLDADIVDDSTCSVIDLVSTPLNVSWPKFMANILMVALLEILYSTYCYFFIRQCIMIKHITRTALWLSF